MATLCLVFTSRPQLWGLFRRRGAQMRFCLGGRWCQLVSPRLLPAFDHLTFESILIDTTFRLGVSFIKLSVYRILYTHMYRLFRLRHLVYSINLIIIPFKNIIRTRIIRDTYHRLSGYRRCQPPGSRGGYRVSSVWRTQLVCAPPSFNCPSSNRS